LRPPLLEEDVEVGDLESQRRVSRKVRGFV
jgi:hypothetical protein